MSDSKGKAPEENVIDSLTQEEFDELYGDDNEEVFVDINDLIESGTKFYALQQYDMAIDRYSHALNILYIYFYYFFNLFLKIIIIN